MNTLGKVIQFPVRQGVDLASGAVRRVTGESAREVDDWGRDPAMVRAVTILARLRWDIATGGADHIPTRKGALVVVNARQYALAPIFTAFALSTALDRPVRFVGRPDGNAVGSLAQRIGGLLSDPEELAPALRAREIVVMGAAPALGTREVGIVDHTLVGAALEAKVPVLPGATTSTPFARHARVEIGPPTPPPARRRGPLRELELADAVQADIHRLLDEMGDINTGTPLDWLPFSGLGSH